ncbi:MAG TPA: ATP-dependent DNA helicase, partial [Acidimicrobiales bacterium]|nr:ATP-dependent DNA helicase [Acidimicrobiales bacterium]
VVSIVDELRALGFADIAGEERRARALGPGIHLAGDLTRVTRTRDDELVFLRRGEREVSIELNLVEVAARLRDELWGAVTPVLSSATIPDALPASLGLAGVAVERVPSPFDYRAHALLYVPEGFPDRRDATATDAIVDELTSLITAAGGRTLALFTNRRVMAESADRVAARVATPVLVQGAGSRARLLRAFRDDASASLFAVASFWQGVDVPGHSLSLVVIDRLPFATPADPLAQARRERSANGFWEVDLPRAAVMLAQGVGRLIRTTEDRGVVAVLDTRLATASYRATLFAQLPPMRRTRSRDEVTAFLRGIAELAPS